MFVLLTVIRSAWTTLGARTGSVSALVASSVERVCGRSTLRAPLSVGLGQSEHLTPTKAHQRRSFRCFDPVCSQILQHTHPVDLRPAHRNHRHRPNAPHPKPWRVTSLSGPTVTSLSGVYKPLSRNERLWNDHSWREADARRARSARPWHVELISM